MGGSKCVAKQMILIHLRTLTVLCLLKVYKKKIARDVPW